MDFIRLNINIHWSKYTTPNRGTLLINQQENNSKNSQNYNGITIMYPIGRLEEEHE